MLDHSVQGLLERRRGVPRLVMVASPGDDVVAGAPVVVGIRAGAVAGVPVVVLVVELSSVDNATRKAANVAVSTAPVGSTPSAVWNACSAVVSSSLQMPSIGPVQYPVNVSTVCSAAVCVSSCSAACRPSSASVSSRARWVAASTYPVGGRPLSVCSRLTASTVCGP